MVIYTQAASSLQQTLTTGTTGQIVATQKLIATGGEGGVFTLLGDHQRVAKIYKADKRTPFQERKLEVMLAHPPTDATRRLVPPHISVAWPTDLLYKTGGRRMAGFLMPRINASSPQILQIYSPVYRSQNYPNLHWKYLHRLALNLAVAFHSLHAKGYVIGDVNACNVLVDPRRALVTLVDTDSIQITDPQTGRVHRCPVGTLEYTPPEMRHVRSFDAVDRTPQCDLFGLGVLIFKLLMEGYHPFMGTPKDSRIAQNAGVTLECIRQGIFPYEAFGSLKPPVNAPPFASLDIAVQDLFRRCFVEGHQDPLRRPTTSEWIDVLEKAERALKQCQQNPTHWYAPQNLECHWCAREKPRLHTAKRVRIQPPSPAPRSPTIPVRRRTHQLPTFLRFVAAGVLVVALTIIVLTLIRPASQPDVPPLAPASSEETAQHRASTVSQTSANEQKAKQAQTTRSFALTSVQPIRSDATGEAMEAPAPVATIVPA